MCVSAHACYLLNSCFFTVSLYFKDFCVDTSVYLFVESLIPSFILF